MLRVHGHASYIGVVLSLMFLLRALVQMCMLGLSCMVLMVGRTNVFATLGTSTNVACYQCPVTNPCHLT